MTEYVLVPRDDYVAICNAVRTKAGTLDLMKSGEVAPVIMAIMTSDDVHLQPVTITPTGVQFVQTPPEGYDGFSQVTVTGDDNLKPENIVAGVTIYGVEGEHECGAGYIIVTSVDDLPDDAEDGTLAVVTGGDV